MIKRLFDLILTVPVFLMLLPIGLVIMIILRFTGEGKVFYFQPRVGLHGHEFNVFKFVTMRSDSEVTGTGDITVRNDPRVLPVGRVLRKTKVNELLQIVNIIRGDMSIVGWRPLMPKGFGYYPEDIQKKIVNVRPGLTGIGSIVFRDEEHVLEVANKPVRDVYIEDIAPYKGRLELWYQEHRCLWLDLQLIFLTAWAVLMPSSRAYRKWYRDLPQPESALLREAFGWDTGNSDTAETATSA